MSPHSRDVLALAQVGICFLPTACARVLVSNWDRPDGRSSTAGEMQLTTVALQ